MTPISRTCVYNAADYVNENRGLLAAIAPRVNRVNARHLRVKIRIGSSRRKASLFD